MPNPNEHRRSFGPEPRWVLPAVLLTVFIVFSPVMFLGFTNWDDDTHLLENRQTENLSPGGIKEIFTSTVHETYIPLIVLSFAVERSAAGTRPFLYHFDNLILHLCVTGLVFYLFLLLGFDAAVAGSGALIFGVHPMHVESVAWVTERKDVLYASFYLASLITYIHYLSKKNISLYAVSVLFAGLSIFSKPMAVSLPMILFVIDWYLRRPFDGRLFAEKIPYALIIGPVTWITYSLHVRTPSVDPSQSLLVWLWTLTFYLKKFFFPAQLLPLYLLPFPVGINQAPYAAAVFWAAVLAVCVFIFRRQRVWMFAVAYFFLSIFFLLRFDAKMDVNIVADRFMYLPSLGFCLFLAYLWREAGQKLRPRKDPIRHIPTAVLVLVVFLFGLKTFFQIRIWKDSVSLWSYVIDQKLPSTIAYGNLGEALMQLKENDRALAYVSKAIELNGNNYEAMNNRGLILKSLGRPEDALEAFNRLIELKSDDPSAFNNRGILYQDLKEYERAIGDYTRAVEFDPDNFKALINRGNVYCILSRYAEAEGDYRKAALLRPEDLNVNFGRGMIFLFAKNDYRSAIGFFDRVLSVDPGHASAHYYRSVCHRELGEKEAARRDALKARTLGFVLDAGYLESLSP